MTENAFPFEGAVEESAGGDRRKMVMVAGLGALLVAVLAYFVVMPAFSGGGTDSTPITTGKKAPAKAKTPAKPAAKKKAPVQPAQYNDLAGRKNPFRPLYVEPKPVAATVPTAGTAPAAPTTDTAAPTTSTGTTTTGTTAPATQRVALMTVFTKDGVSYAQTKVGEVVYIPKVGQVFAGSFKLLAVTAKTATYLYGDEQFTLSVGQEVMK